jgi:hypothetical protein
MRPELVGAIGKEMNQLAIGSRLEAELNFACHFVGPYEELFPE